MRQLLQVRLNYISSIERWVICMHFFITTSKYSVYARKASDYRAYVESICCDAWPLQMVFERCEYAFCWICKIDVLQTSSNWAHGLIKRETAHTCPDINAFINLIHKSRRLKREKTNIEDNQLIWGIQQQMQLQTRLLWKLQSREYLHRWPRDYRSLNVRISCQIGTLCANF